MDIRTKSTSVAPRVIAEEPSFQSGTTKQSSVDKGGISALQDALENANLPNAFRDAVQHADTGINLSQNLERGVSSVENTFEKTGSKNTQETKSMQNPRKGSGEESTNSLEKSFLSRFQQNGNDRNPLGNIIDPKSLIPASAQFRQSHGSVSAGLPSITESLTGQGTGESHMSKDMIADGSSGWSDWRTFETNNYGHRSSSKSREMNNPDGSRTTEHVHSFDNTYSLKETKTTKYGVVIDSHTEETRTENHDDGGSTTTKKTVDTRVNDDGTNQTTTTTETTTKNADGSTVHTTETVNSDGSSTTTTEMKNADGSTSTTTTTTPPSSSKGSKANAGDPGGGDLDDAGSGGRGGSEAVGGLQPGLLSLNQVLSFVTGHDQESKDPLGPQGGENSVNPGPEGYSDGKTSHLITDAFSHYDKYQLIAQPHPDDDVTSGTGVREENPGEYTDPTPDGN